MWGIQYLYQARNKWPKWFTDYNAQNDFEFGSKIQNDDFELHPAFRITGCAKNLAKTQKHKNHTSLWPSNTKFGVQPPNQFYQMLECAVFHKNNLGWQRNELCSGQTFPFHRIFTSKTKLRISITKLNITSKSVSQSGQFIEG